MHCTEKYSETECQNPDVQKSNADYQNPEEILMYKKDNLKTPYWNLSKGRIAKTRTSMRINVIKFIDMKVNLIFLFLSGLLYLIVA
jgi:hypothetical protein